MKTNWNSVFVFLPDLREWRKVAEVESEGLTNIAVFAFQKIYGERSVISARGKNCPAPVHIPE